MAGARALAETRNIGRDQAQMILKMHKGADDGAGRPCRCAVVIRPDLHKNIRRFPNDASSELRNRPKCSGSLNTSLHGAAAENLGLIHGGQKVSAASALGISDPAAAGHGVAACQCHPAEAATAAADASGAAGRPTEKAPSARRSSSGRR